MSKGKCHSLNPLPPAVSSAPLAARWAAGSNDQMLGANLGPGVNLSSCVSRSPGQSVQMLSGLEELARRKASVPGDYPSHLFRRGSGWNPAGNLVVQGRFEEETWIQLILSPRDQKHLPGAGGVGDSAPTGL